MGRSGLTAVLGLTVGIVVGCGKPAPPTPPTGSADRMEEWGYRLKWPAEPTVSDQAVELPLGKADTHDATATVRGPGTFLTFSVIVRRYAAGGKIDDTSPRDVIQTFLSGRPKMIRDEKTTDTELGPKKYPATELNGERAGNRFRELIVVAGRDQYVVTVTGTPAHRVDGPDGDQFLGSFEIIK